jgi:hypothetical protein
MDGARPGTSTIRPDDNGSKDQREFLLLLQQKRLLGHGVAEACPGGSQALCGDEFEGSDGFRDTPGTVGEPSLSGRSGVERTSVATWQAGHSDRSLTVSS